MNPLQSTSAQPGILSQAQQPMATSGFATGHPTMSQPASQAYVSSTRQWSSPATTALPATTSSIPSATTTSTSWKPQSYAIPSGFSQPNVPYKFSDYYTQCLSSGASSTQASAATSAQPLSQATSTSFAARPSTSSSFSSSSFTQPSASSFTQSSTPSSFTQRSPSSSFTQPTTSSFSQPTSTLASSSISAQPTTLASTSATAMAPSQLAQTGKAPSSSSFTSQQQPTMLPRTSSQYTESGRVAPLQKQQSFPQQQQQQQQQYYIPGQATQPQGVLSAQPSATHYAPTTVELREKPAVIQEVVRPGLREEIQPVIHRERQQTEIREELQPVYEKSIRPTQYEQKTLTPEYRTETTGNLTPVIAPGPVGSTMIQPEHKEIFVNPPVVEETIRKKIVEEIQPIVHRETLAPKLVQETQPIYERVIESPVVNYTVLPARYDQTTFSPGFRGFQEGPFDREFSSQQGGFQGNQFMSARDLKKYEQERMFRDNMAPGFIQRY